MTVKDVGTIKRTYPTVKHLNGGQWVAGDPVTCEVTGESADGSKVWTDPTTGTQYFAFRLLGKYYFERM